MPILSIFSGILGRIGGWALFALAALGALWFGRRQAKSEGIAEAKQEQEIANGRAAMDRVRSDETVRSAGADAAREQLRRDWSK
jgi:hypothetical protein